MYEVQGTLTCPPTPPHPTPPHPTPQSRYSKTCVLRERFSVRRLKHVRYIYIYMMCVLFILYIYSLVETTSRAQVQSQWVCHQPFQSQGCLSRRIVTPAACNPSKSEGPCSKTNYIFWFVLICLSFVRKKSLETVLLPVKNVGLKPCN